MSSIETAAERTIKEYFQKLTALGLKLTAVEKLDYHFELSASKDKDKIKLQVFFGKKGTKTVLQGDQKSKLYDDVYKMIHTDLLSLETEELKEPKSYIGTDESGKGDYFGPLVVAGVIVDENNVSFLKSMGVRDSKELSDSSIKKIAHEIKKIETIKFNIISISPKKYNELHSRIGNVNRILGWAHAKVIENLLDKNSVEEVISDKFGDEKYIYSSLQEHGKQIILHQITKAEKYTAVAAASILARDRFNSWFKNEKQKLGLELPKGASEVCETAAKTLVEKLGSHSLKDFVKLHFKNTQRLGIENK